MNQKKPTKYYSSLQERRIADHLGWSVVSASGARPFNPGDVQSSTWLCECKTHTEIRDKITISKPVWKKLSNEADSKMRKPVLFIDNGSQKISDTYAIIRKPKYEDLPDAELNCQLRESTKSFTFSHAKNRDIMKCGGYGSLYIEGEALMLMTLSYFKEFIDRRSEDA